MVLLSRVERLSGVLETSKDVLLKEQFVDNLKNLTLRRDINRWARDHPTATFQDVRLEVHQQMEEDTAPKRSAAVRCAEVEEEIQSHEVTGQKEQHKVLTDLISGKKVLAEELQKQQKVLAAHVEMQREVLSWQQETLNHLLTTLVSKPRFSSCYCCGKDASCLESILSADDTNLFISEKDPVTMNNILNSEFNKDSAWFAANQLSLNISKTKFIVFRPRQKTLP